MGSKVIQRNLTGIFLYSSNAINIIKVLKKKKKKIGAPKRNIVEYVY